jgi:flagellar hook-basal body complex protein FliE
MVLNIADALSAYRQGGGGVSNASGAGSAVSDAGSGSFSETLKGFTSDVVGSLQESEQAATAGATGKADLASIVTAISKAETMLQTVVTIRDKVIAAYQDISKTAI